MKPQPEPRPSGSVCRPRAQNKRSLTVAALPGVLATLGYPQLAGTYRRRSLSSRTLGQDPISQIPSDYCYNFTNTPHILNVTCTSSYDKNTSQIFLDIPSLGVTIFACSKTPDTMMTEPMTLFCKQNKILVP